MEIKTQDLRIGNYLHYPNWNNDGKNVVFKVRDLYFEDGKIALTNGIIQVPHTNLKHLKPIPLTEEVLLRCGATETESYTYEFTQIGKDIDLCVKFCELDILVTIWQGDPVYLRYDFVDFYLHTLQNLHYSLCGEELTYNHS